MQVRDPLAAAADREDWDSLESLVSDLYPHAPGIVRELRAALDGAEIVDFDALGACFHEIGCEQSDGGDPEGALWWFQRAAEISSHGDHEGHIDWENVGQSLDEAASCHLQLGRVDDAIADLEAAIETKERGGRDRQVDGESLSHSLHALGACLLDKGEPAQALVCFERAVAVGRDVAPSCHQAGACLGSLRAHEDALSWFARGARLARDDAALEATCLHEAGYAAFKLDRLGEARSFFERAIALREQLDEPAPLARSMQALAVLHGLSGELLEARELRKAAFALETGAETGAEGGDRADPQK